MRETTHTVDPEAAARRAGRLAHVLLVAGGALVALAAGARVLSSVESRTGLERFLEAKARLGSARARAVGWEALEPDRSLWAAGRIAGWQQSLEEDLGIPRAVLRITRLRLEVPVWEGVDERTLNRGIGLVPGTAPVEGPGNIGLAGHRDGFFRVLEGIAPGDQVELETLAGARSFTVAQIWIVDPQSVWVLDPTPQTSLTLVTCYPFYYVGKAPTSRFVVRALATGGRRPPEREQNGDGAVVAGRTDALW
jgi:sortase A